MRTAIVGYGNIGKVHLEILLKLGVEVCAVCDVDYAKIEELTANKYTDYTQMLEREKPDVVHICTPHHLHADMVVGALQKDIHVLCEKPLCIHRSEIERILQAEKDSKAMLGVCHQNRYNAQNRFVKDHFCNKKIVSGHGKVLWHRDTAYYQSNAWRGKWVTEGGGVLINQALHTLDLMIWFLGEPNIVESELANLSLVGVIEVEDTAKLVCKGEDFAFTFYATNANEKSLPIEISLETDTESIKIFDDRVTINSEDFLFERDERVYGKACYGTGHEKLFMDFYHSIERGKPFAINGAEGAKVIKVILSAYEKGELFLR